MADFESWTVSTAIKMVYSTHIDTLTSTHIQNAWNRKKVCNQKEKLNVSIYRHCHISHTTSHHYPYIYKCAYRASEWVREREMKRTNVNVQARNIPHTYYTTTRIYSKWLNHWISYYIYGTDMNGMVYFYYVYTL